MVLRVQVSSKKEEKLFGSFKNCGNMQKKFLIFWNNGPIPKKNIDIKSYGPDHLESKMLVFYIVLAYFRKKI